MKTALHYSVIFLLIVFVSSCASQKGLEFAGHYKPQNEARRMVKTDAANSAEENSSSSASNTTVVVSDEPSPDLELSEKKVQQSNGAQMLKEKQQQKAEKLIQKIESKMEKQTAKLELQSLKTDQSTAQKGKASVSTDLDLGWLILFAILLPPLAVALVDGIGTSFWISIILTLLFWVPGVIYALIVVIP